MEQDEKQKQFEDVVRPVMKWLAKNTDPHTQIIIACNTAEMLSGEMVLTDNQYIAD